MRVLILTSEYIPVWGGIGTYVYEIVRNLPDECEILVVAPKRDDGNDNHEMVNSQRQGNNVHVHYISNAKGTFLFNLKHQIACKRHLERLIDDFEPDIIHTQSSMPDIFIDPERIGVPIVITIHSTVTEQIQALKGFGVKFWEMSSSEKMMALSSPILRAMERGYYKKRKNVITVSHHYADLLLKGGYGEFERMVVVHNGVDTDLYNPINSQRSSDFFPKLGSIESPKVLFLSRLVGIKGIHTLIKSMDRVGECSNAHFIVGGTGNVDPTSIIKRSNATYLGYVPHEITPYLYGSADIFVLPSYHENCPLSLLEAMASGLAVIAANVGGVSEIIDHERNGLLINNDPDELADAIIRLSNDDGLRLKMAKAARATVEDHFTWKKTAKQTYAFYEQVTSQ